MRRMRRYEGNEHHTVVELTKLGFFLAFFAVLSRFQRLQRAARTAFAEGHAQTSEPTQEVWIMGRHCSKSPEHDADLR